MFQHVPSFVFLPPKKRAPSFLETQCCCHILTQYCCHILAPLHNFTRKRQALEEVSVSTPRDLVRMGAFPDVLVGAVRDRVGAERFAPLAGLITAEAVEAWRRKGDRLLEQRPWLELWVHQG